MDKFVEIRFVGKADQFFSVNYQILDSDHKVIDGGKSSLPNCPELISSIKDWRAAYHADVRSRRLERKEIYANNSSDVDHRKLTNNLKTHLNNWLSSLEFQSFKEKLFAKLNPREVVLVGIETDDADLKYVPWHLWSFFDTFSRSDYTLLRPNFSKRDDNFGDRKKETRSQRNIMAIIGDSTGINTEEDRTIIKSLPGVHNLQILSEPSRAEVVEFLWDSRDTDILFFAGHGKKDQDQGRICINAKETLGIEEIRSCLQKRIQEGLQLAIFNSCDGLELGEAIADLHIPQAIVMKEAVPDDIAQRFLKDFLKEFSGGVPFVQALRQTRNKLKDQEGEYPYASWLPVLYCNPTEPLLQWPKPNLVQRYPWRTGLAASCLIGLVGILGVSLIPSVMTRSSTDIQNTSLEQTQKFKYENVELNYPMTWVVQKELNTPIGEVANFYLKDNREVVIGLFIRKLDTSMGLEDYYNKELIDELKGGLDKSEIKKESATLGAKNGYRVFVSGNINGKRQRKMVVFTLKNNQAYIMIYSAPEELFSSYESTAEKVIGSLKFLDW